MEYQRAGATYLNAYDGVGAILKKLRDTGLEKNTLVVFLSDNGAEQRVGGENGEIFQPGLCNQHAIERIPMVPRQRRHVQRVAVLDRKRNHTKRREA